MMKKKMMKMILLFLPVNLSAVPCRWCWQGASQSGSGPECRLCPRQSHSVLRQISIRTCEVNSHRIISPSAFLRKAVGQLIIFLIEPSRLDNFIFRSDHEPTRRGVLRKTENAAPGSTPSPSPSSRPSPRSQWSRPPCWLQDRARPGRCSP